MSEKSNDKVRIGIIGVGGMGSYHASYLLDEKVKNCELTAVCDIDSSKLERFTGILRYSDSAELIRSGDVDAVIVATPHYAHTWIGIDALKNGLHLLTEKPISAHKADAERLIAAHTNKDQVFAAMFQQRTMNLYIKLKKLIESGELGEITRVNWVASDWFRTEAYYASGGWRATWEGEGGGVLLNQCPHTIDMMQWLCGMPVKVKAFCKFGAKHNIEVEDEVTAYFEYANGATGVFVANTGEAPGTNRLEIAAENGKVVVENGKINFTRNETPTSVFCKTCNSGFDRPEVWNVDVPYSHGGGDHLIVTQNFVNAIYNGTPLIAPAEEGIKSLELANAMIYSQITGQTVDLPLDSAAYEEVLKGLIAQSKYVKPEVQAQEMNLTTSFKK
ncbi:MAG: Gfo/Idh/MocA family oxidoreductase [Armatimonadota bacterium]|nr:Gfo/Idh/MocA family oxidoreductase [bacterium]